MLITIPKWFIFKQVILVVRTGFEPVRNWVDFIRVTAYHLRLPFRHLTNDVFPSVKVLLLRVYLNLVFTYCPSRSCEQWLSGSVVRTGFEPVIIILIEFWIIKCFLPWTRRMIISNTSILNRLKLKCVYQFRHLTISLYIPKCKQV